MNPRTTNHWQRAPAFGFRHSEFDIFHHLPLFAILYLLFSILSLPAATVTGDLKDISIQALNTSLVFTPTNDVLVTGAGLGAGPPKLIDTASGQFSLVLEAGDYTVALPLIPWRKPFPISVPNSTDPINITNLLAAPKTYTYTNNLDFTLKATPADSAPNVLGAKLQAGACLDKKTNTVGTADTIVLSIPTNAQIKALSLSLDGPQVYYDWLGISNGLFNVPAFNSDFTAPSRPGLHFLNTNTHEMAYIGAWADHGNQIDTPELLIQSARSLALIPGTDGAGGANVQLGQSNPSHDLFYAQYDDDPATTSWSDGITSWPIGHSKRVGFAARGAINSSIYGEALPGLIGVVAATNINTSLGANFQQLGELWFYTILPQFSGGNFNSSPGVRVGRMLTNGWDLRGNLIQQSAVAASGSSCVVDFAGAFCQVMDVSASAVTFTTANLPPGTANFQQAHLIIRSGPYAPTFTFPGWRWGNEAGSASAPASLTSEKALDIWLRALGSSDGTVLASYTIHSWPFSYDSDAQAFFTRASISDTTQKLAVHQLVLDAKAHGWWSLCDAIYPFVGGNSTAHSKNLKANTFNITWSGTVTHDANGITGNASTGYGDTGFVPSSAGGQYAQSSAHLLVYVGTALPTDLGQWIGVVDNSSHRASILRQTSSFAVSGLNNNLNLQSLITHNNEMRGPILLSRTASNLETLYIPASNTGETTASTGLPTFSFFLLARNGAGAADNFSNVNLRGASIGGAISSSLASTMRSDWDNFEQTLSRKVP